MKGEPCNIGETCIKNVPEMTFERKPESFNTTAYLHTFSKIKKEIEASDDLSSTKVEELVRKEFPGDIYLNNPLGIIKERDNGRTSSTAARY